MIISPIAMLNLNEPSLQEAGVNSTILTLGNTTTTACIHYFFSSYVTKLYLHPPLPISKKLTSTSINPYTKITMETHSLFAKPRFTTLQLKDLIPTIGKRALTWKVKKDYLKNCIIAGINLPKQRRFWLDIESAKTDFEMAKKMIEIVKKDNRLTSLF
ncbi:10359_t:CDS:2 [Diversispora eburnea]|uniref:10359_t:CDS:1 n=1 Tax=Diversispora eburnea TaxID=1213867 RepID=A0A9N8Z3Z0_9GLOM|nr:10359_t:CDS:2 [Diversispora eburnea]